MRALALAELGNYLYHQMNMIAEGVFERFPGLKFVWGDGAADFITPFMWRMDTFGRPHLEQTPWAPRLPSEYLPGHVYFVQGSLDGEAVEEAARSFADELGSAVELAPGSAQAGCRGNSSRASVRDAAASAESAL